MTARELHYTPTTAHDRVHVIEGVLDPATCRMLIDRLDDDRWLTTTADLRRITVPHRRSEPEAPCRLIGLDEAPRFAVIDDAKLALRIFYRIAGVLPESLGDAQLAGLKQVLRCVRLHAGEGTEAHHDVARECTQGMHSHLSVVVFLNENQGRDRGFVGGGIEFPTLGLHVPAKTGRALLIPHELLHRDALIERGDAFVLHAEVFYARDWLPLP